MRKHVTPELLLSNKNGFWQRQAEWSIKNSINLHKKWLIGAGEPYTFAIIQPAVWPVRRECKREKLFQYGERDRGIVD